MVKNRNEDVSTAGGSTYSKHVQPGCIPVGTSHVVLVVKNLPANAGNINDVGSIPGSGRSPGGGWHPTPLFLPENPIDRGAW